MNKFLIMLCLLMSGCMSDADIAAYNTQLINNATENFKLFLNKLAPEATNHICSTFFEVDWNNCYANLGGKLMQFKCSNEKINGICYLNQ